MSNSDADRPPKPQKKEMAKKILLANYQKTKILKNLKYKRYDSCHSCTIGSEE